MSTFDPAAFTPPLRVPRLASPPLVLRPYLVSDLALVRRAAADPFIPSISSVPRAYTDDAGRAFIERQHARSAEGDGYSFVIAPEAEPRMGIGSIGLWLQEIESGRASIGYWLIDDARGQGLAANALRAVVTFAFGTLSIPRLHLFVEPWNVASARTAAAAGFEREATLRGWERIDGQQRDADCFALLHSQWTATPVW
jgi:[ribosomal protein S5]-alanine N-acetyltransferase